LVVDYLMALNKLGHIKKLLANDPTPTEVGYQPGSKFDEGHEGICRQCKHELPPHLITAPYGTQILEGEIFCPVEGCTCFHTWSVAKKQEK